MRIILLGSYISGKDTVLAFIVTLGFLQFSIRNVFGVKEDNSDLIPKM